MDRIIALVTDAISATPALLPMLVPYAVGVACASLVGVRGRILPFVSAVPLLIGAAALAGQLYSFVGVATSPLLLLLTPLVVSAGYYGLRRLAKRRGSAVGSEAPADAPEGLRWVALGGIGGAALGLGVWLAGVAHAGTPPQSNDDIFHGYLVARLADATDVAAQTIAPVLVGQAQPVSYYPYGMHLFMSMAQAVSPAGVPMVMNGTWMLLVGVLFPLSSAATAWALYPGRPRTALWAGLLAPAVTVPYLLNGIMSYVMTLALLPAALTLVLRMRSAPSDVPGPVLALVLTSLFISHPAVAVNTAIVVACVLAMDLLGGGTSAVKSSLVRLSPPLLSSVVLVLPWYLAAGSAGVGGGAYVVPEMGSVAAISSALRLATPWAPAQLLLAALVAAGAVATLRWRAGRGVVLAYLVFIGLYASVLADFSPISARTGIWYGQWYRLVGMAAVLVPVVAGLGAELAVAMWSRGRANATRRSLRRAWISVLAVAVAVSGMAMARYLLRAESIVASAWGHTAVTQEDREFFEAASALVGKDDQVLNYWADGSTWMYALAGLTPAVPYVTSAERVGWAGEAINRVPEIQDIPELCRELRDRNVRFALAKDTLNSGAPNTFRAALEQNTELFREVARSRSYALYSVRQPVLERCIDEG